jgi:hypothetical protein
MESSQTEHKRESRRKYLVVFGIVIPVALLHFVTGPGYKGPFPVFVNGYMIDILLPTAAYFLLVFLEPQVPLLRRWYAKSALVFAFGAGVEIAQFFGLPVLGRTFDPLDFAMYGAGVLLAAVLDTLVFPRLFSFWARYAG